MDSSRDRFRTGLTAAQKRQWVAVANRVLAECIRNGGQESTCAGRAIRTANGLFTNSHKDMETYRILVKQKPIRKTGEDCPYYTCYGCVLSFICYDY